MLSITPLSSTHSRLQRSALTRNTDTRLEQLGRGDATKSPLDASLCHSQFGYACNNRACILTAVRTHTHTLTYEGTTYCTCNNGDLCVSNVTPARFRGTHARVAGFPLNSLGVVTNILSQPDNIKRVYNDGRETRTQKTPANENRKLGLSLGFLRV